MSGKEGQVLSCGYGKFGQCGVGDIKTQQRLVKINIEAVRIIECGDGHCIAVDSGKYSLVFSLSSIQHSPSPTHMHNIHEQGAPAFSFLLSRKLTRTRTQQQQHHHTVTTHHIIS